MFWKKKGILVFLLLLVCSLFFLEEMVGFYIQKKAESRGIIFSYEKLSFSKKGLFFSKADFSFSGKKSTLKTDAIQVRYTFPFEFTLFLEKPHFSIFPEKLPPFSSEKGGGASLASFEGTFSFEGKELPKGEVLYDSSCKKLSLGLEKKGEILINKCLSSKTELFQVELFEVALEKWVNFFPILGGPLEVIEGRVTGELFFDLAQKKIVSCRASIQDFKGEKEGGVLSSAKIKIELQAEKTSRRYPLYHDSFLEKLGASPFFIEATEVEAVLRKTPLLQKGELFFSYNPLVGAKVNVEGLLLQREAFSLEGRSFFSCTKENWLQASIKLPSLGKEKLVFQGKGEQERVQIGVFLPYLDPFYMNSLQKIIPSCADMQWEKGVFKAFLELTISKENTRLCFTDVKAEGLCLSQKGQRRFCLEKGSFLGEVSWKGGFEKEKLSVHKMEAEIEGLSVQGEKAFLVEEGKGHIQITENTFYKSAFFAVLHQFKTEVNIKGPLTAVSVQTKLQGKGSALPKDLQKMLPLFEEEDTLCIEALGSLSKEKLLFSSDIIWERGKEKLFFKGGGESSLHKTANLFLDKGWLLAKEFPLEKLNFFWSERGKTKGNSTFLLTYEKEKYSLEGIGESLSYGGEDFSLFLPNCKKPFQIFWEKEKPGWDACIALEGATLVLPEKNLVFEQLKGEIYKKEDQIALSLDKALSKGVFFQGEAKLTLLEKGEVLYEVFADQIRSSLSDALLFASQFMEKEPFFSFEKGRFLGEKLYVKGFLKKEEAPLWSFTGEFLGGEVALSSQFPLQSISGKIEKKLEGAFYVKGLKGELFLEEKKEPLKLYVPFFCKEKEGFFTDVRVERDLYEIARIKASLEKQGDQYRALLDPDFSHFMGKKLHVETCLWGENFSVEALKGSLSLDLSQASFFSDLFPFLEKPLLGDIQVSWDLGKENTLFAKAEKVKIGDSWEAPFQLFIKKEQAVWKIDSLQLGDIKAKGKLDQDYGKTKQIFFFVEKSDSFQLEGDLFLQDLKKISGNVKSLWFRAEAFPSYFKNMKGDIEASGGFFIHKKEKEPLSWEIDLDLLPQKIQWEHLTLYSEKPTFFHFSSKEGALLKGLSLRLSSEDVDLSSLFCKVDTIHFHNQWFFEKAEVYLQGKVSSFLDKMVQTNKAFSFFSPSWFIEEEKRDLKWSGDIWLSRRGDALSFDLKELYIPIQEEMYLFKDISLIYEPEKCFIQGECFREKTSFFFEAKTNLLPFLKGELLLKEKKEEKTPFTLSWSFEEKESLRIREVKGNFFGIEASLFEKDFRKKGGTLLGSLYFDFSSLTPLLPRFFRTHLEKAQIGEGYELKGVFAYGENPYFDGVLSGKDFEIGGFCFKTLLSKMHWDKSSLELKDLKMSDSSGMLKMESFSMQKTKKGKKVSIPKIEIKEFRPSLMKKLKKELAPLQPFLIRKAVLEKIGGYIEDPSSFKAKGSLFFINSFKREHTVFDIPSDVLGSIFGLDLELLIPVRGEVELELKEGKLFLLSLNEAYSENNRSKFFFVEKDTPPFIDLEGNLHINVKMKQYVLFKFTENFIIKIRGNLENPKFSLNRKKSFFSDV